MLPKRQRKIYYSCCSSLRTTVFALGFLMCGTAVSAAINSPTSPNYNVEVAKTHVEGVVVDANGAPLIGVSVVQDGTSNGFVTDMDGHFSLSVPVNSTLKISYVGYETQYVTVKDQKNLRIVLREDSKALSEVVVVGYGTIRKADLAGSVSVLGSKSFKDQPLTRAADALQGRVSGVNVENSGIPGGAIKIRVRGTGSINKSNDPLYVVDGIVRESGLDGINPEDIQSIQVLKDASSTAIYGARGANGVVMITTKTGKNGVREIMFDASLGIATLPKKYDLLKPYEYAKALEEVKGIRDFTADQLEAYRNGSAGIDWQDEIFRTGYTQNYKLAVSNGNANTQYYISGNFMKQSGIIINSDYRRYQAKASISSQLTDWLHVNADVNASHNIRRGGGLMFDKGNPLWVALNYSPTMEMRDKSGKYNVDPYNSIARNPIGDLRENTSEFMSNVFNGRLELKFNIAKGLTFTTTNGVDYNDSKAYFFTSSLVRATNGMSNVDNYRMMLQTSNTLNYLGDFGDHHLDATLVYEATSSNDRMIDITGKNLLTESVHWWNIGNANTRDAENGTSKWAIQSYVGRLVYNYHDRYRVTGTLRADGSSRFMKKKWGWFPSIAAAWTVSNENFMKDFNALQDIKLRMSYGVVGNQAIQPYSTLGLLKTIGYGFGSSTNLVGYANDAIATPDVTWESTRQFDLGVEFGVFNKRLNVSFDYFYKKSPNALVLKDIPGYRGGGKYWVNDGVISNKGVELTLDANILSTKDFSWNSNLNVSYIKNRVEKLAGGTNDFVWGSKPAPGMVDQATIIKPGYAIGTFWGYKWTGLDKDGKDTYLDVDGKNGVDGNDRMDIGKYAPDVTFGWNNTLTYKNWDVNFFINGAFGASRLNLVRFGMASMVGDSRFITLREAYTEGFDKKGAGAFYPSLTATGNRYEAVSTKWFEKADYVRLENLSVSYNLSKKVTKFADLRLTLSCQNLFTITGYSGYDPAGSNFSEGHVDVDGGVDIGAYPTPRTITFGVRMTF